LLSGGSSVGGEYDDVGRYGDRGGEMRRPESGSNAMNDSDPYYSSFSDLPSRTGYSSHDYNHGAGE